MDVNQELADLHLNFTGLVLIVLQKLLYLHLVIDDTYIIS